MNIYVCNVDICNVTYKYVHIRKGHGKGITHMHTHLERNRITVPIDFVLFVVVHYDILHLHVLARTKAIKKSRSYNHIIHINYVAPY
jgi:hypothetical protein